MKYLALLPYADTNRQPPYHLARPDGQASYCGAVGTGIQRDSGHTWTLVDERPQGYECSNCPGAKAAYERVSKPPEKTTGIINLISSRFGDSKIHWANGQRKRCAPNVAWSSKYFVTKGDAESVTCKRCRKLLGLGASEAEAEVGVSLRIRAKWEAWTGEELKLTHTDDESAPLVCPACDEPRDEGNEMLCQERGGICIYCWMDGVRMTDPEVYQVDAMEIL